MLNGCLLVWPNKQVLSVFEWPIRNLQSFTKYLGQTLVFMSYSILWEKFKFCFWKDTGTENVFISGEGLSTMQEFYKVLRFSYFLRSYFLFCFVFGIGRGPKHPWFYFKNIYIYLHIYIKISASFSPYIVGRAVQFFILFIGLCLVIFLGEGQLGTINNMCFFYKY